MSAILSASAETQRIQLLDHFLQTQFGLTVSAYTDSLLQKLFDELPPEAPLSSPEAVEVILRTLAIHETYFFRHPDQLKAVPDLARALVTPGVPLRVWSACCSTGEEAYTLSAILSRVPLGGGHSILGTDLDPTAIGTAQEATYRRWSMRGMVPDEHRDWLECLDDGVVRVRDSVRAAVRFQVHNLMSPDWPGGFDLILCRNALIYFSTDNIAALYRRFFQALRPGGVLLVAASDPVPSVSTGWKRESLGRVFYFRRPKKPSTTVVRTIPRSKPVASTITNSPKRTPRPRTRRTEQGPLRPVELPRPSLETISSALKERPADTVLLVQATVLAVSSDDRRTAQRFARRLLMLQPDGIVANLLVGHVFGDETLYAAVRLKAACDRLARLGAAEPVPLTNNLNAGTLRQLLGGDNGISSLIERLR